MNVLLPLGSHKVIGALLMAMISVVQIFVKFISLLAIPILSMASTLQILFF